jgi:hypothetical protein
MADAMTISSFSVSEGCCSWLRPERLLRSARACMLADGASISRRVSSALTAAHFPNHRWPCCRTVMALPVASSTQVALVPHTDGTSAV